MTEEESFLKAIDQGDSLARDIFADWLLDRDDPREPGVRALIALGLRPHLTDHRNVRIWGYHDGTGLMRVTYGPEETVSEAPAPTWAALPTFWFEACWDDHVRLVGTDEGEIFNSTWLISDRISTCDLLAVEGFLKLPAVLQAQYLEGRRE